MSYGALQPCADLHNCTDGSGIRDGKTKPSQQLADAVERMLKGNTEFVLIDEQKVVFEKALALAYHLREGRHGVLGVGL